MNLAAIFENCCAGAKKRPLFTRLAVLAIAVLYPYFCFLGGFPGMDEGVYAWTAVTYHHDLISGRPLAPMQGFSLWSLLLSWIPALPGLSLLWFRLADMAAAFLAGWLFCEILEKECGAYSAVLALAVLICLTNHHVIDNGFKNSFFPAWACFFGAIRLVSRNPGEHDQKIWIFAGALAALGIMLRETFFPFAFLGLAAAFRLGSFRASLYYVLGGALAALLILGLVEWTAPGSLSSLYKGYADRAAVYQVQRARIIPNLISYGLRSLLLFSPALLLFLLTFLWWLRFRTSGTNSLPRDKIVFWLCVALLPLYEPAIKISFYYHFAVCLPGLAFLAAQFAALPQADLREALQGGKKAALLLLSAGFLAVLASFAALPPVSSLANTIEALARQPDRQWPPHLVSQSTTLRVIDEIGKALPSGGTVSVNGCAFFILAAGGFAPPLSGSFDEDDNYFLSDLARFYLNVKGDKGRVKEALLANPPDVIVLMRPIGRHEPTFTEELTEILQETGLYEKIAEVDPKGTGDYVWVGYELYRRKS